MTRSLISALTGLAIAAGVVAVGVAVFLPRAGAQDSPAPPPVAAASPTPVATAAPPPRTIGRETGLPLPRYVSLRGDEGRARRGPSRSQRIDWVFTRSGMPLEVVAEFDTWRKVRDRDGAGGWVHVVSLSRERTVIVQDDLVALRSAPGAEATIRARAEAGVIARLGSCTELWCRIHVGRTNGWVPKTALWGVAPDELRD
jgi:SH3-like domain-containing protein